MLSASSGRDGKRARLGGGCTPREALLTHALLRSASGLPALTLFAFLKEEAQLMRYVMRLVQRTH